MLPTPKNVTTWRILSLALLLGVCLITGDAGAQERRRREVREAAPLAGAALPDLSACSQLELSLPEEGAGVVAILKVRKQEPDGQFSGLLLRIADPPTEAPVRGRVSRTDTGGFRLVFTRDLGPETYQSFEGAISLARARREEGGRIHVAGTYTVLEDRQVTGGPFPFSGSGPLAAAAPAGAPAPEAPAPQPPPRAPAPPPASGGTGAVTRRNSERILRNGGISDRVVVENRDVFKIRADLWTTMERQGNLTTFLRLARAAGQEEYIRGGKITLLAPEDAAFARLPAGTVDGLLRPESRERLLQYVNYCIAYGGKYLTLPEGKPGALPFPAERIETRTAALGVSREGSRLWLRGNDSRRAEVIKRDIEGGNGALFITNVVLFPKSVRID